MQLVSFEEVVLPQANARIAGAGDDGGVGQDFNLDRLHGPMPHPLFTEARTDAIASRSYDHVWQKSASGQALAA